MAAVCDCGLMQPASNTTTTAAKAFPVRTVAVSLSFMGLFRGFGAGSQPSHVSADSKIGATHHALSVATRPWFFAAPAAPSAKPNWHCRSRGSLERGAEPLEPAIR